MKNLIKLSAEETLKFVLDTLKDKPKKDQITRIHVFGTGEQALKLKDYLLVRLPTDYKIKLMHNVSSDDPFEMFEIDVYDKSVPEYPSKLALIED